MLLEQPRLRTSARANGESLLFVATLMVFLLATRLPLAPRYLYYFDSANFALALDDFNPALHQPQPPGYPLFVLLLRVLHLWLPRPETVLLAAGLLAAAGATVLALLLGRSLFGREAGILAAALLASHPVFWLAGITNEIRLFLALSALAVAWLGWHALEHPAEPRWLYATFATLGVAGGFRPVCSVLLLPLVGWVWWQTGHNWRRLAAGMGWLAVCACPWIAATVWAVGGLDRAAKMISDYASDQFGTTSLLFGAQPVAAYGMFEKALVWTFLGSVVWLWALPFVAGRMFRGKGGRAAVFLAIGIAPALLLSALVHIGDPDQALASVALLSVLGGAVLAAISERANWRFVYRTAALAAAAHVILFLKPLPGPAEAATLRAAERVNRMMTPAIDSIRAIRRDRPLTIVHWGSPVASRELTYYFPDDYVVVLPWPSGDGHKVAEVFHNRRPLISLPGPEMTIVTGSARVVLLTSSHAADSLPRGWEPSGAVFTREVGDAQRVDVGPYRLLLAGM